MIPLLVVPFVLVMGIWGFYRPGDAELRPPDRRRGPGRSPRPRTLAGQRKLTQTVACIQRPSTRNPWELKLDALPDDLASPSGVDPMIRIGPRV